MRRRLFTLAAGVSSVLCVITAVLWACSYRFPVRALVSYSDVTGRQARGGKDGFYFANGGVAFLSFRWSGTWDTQQEAESGRDVIHPHDEVSIGWRSANLRPEYPLDAEPTNGSLWNRAGFRRHAAVDEDPAGALDYLNVDATVVPAWGLLAVTTVLPAVKVFAWMGRRRRRARGLCPSCGYDLRATPARCPECGTESKG